MSRRAFLYVLVRRSAQHQRQESSDEQIDWQGLWISPAGQYTGLHSLLDLSLRGTTR